MILAAPAAGARCAAAEPRATLRIIVNLKTRSAPARRVCVGRMILLALAGPAALAAGGCVQVLTKSLDGHSDPDDETIKQHRLQPAS